MGTRSRRSHGTGFFRRFARASRGAAAVEFALLALPFFGLLFAVFEIGMLFLISTTLENATADAARMIRTGQMQSANATVAAFKTQICSELAWVGSNCASNLSVNVQTFSSFSGVTPVNPITNKTVNTAAMQFNMGAAGDIVLVQAFYQWKLVAPLIDGATPTLNNGMTLISATAVFRNEPYSAAP